jgi:sugar O-acyltransferase (sialic acid O-acetyltransferase NeuD family)
MRKLIIVGGGEFAEIADQYFSFDSDYEVIGFCVERAYIKSDEINGKPVFAYEEIEQRFPSKDHFLFIAIPSSDMNRLRKRFYLDAKAKGYQFASYISSRAFVWRNVQIGENTFIFENNVIQPFVTIGNNCVIWSGNHIGHRSIVKDHVFFSSHVVVSGYCVIGEGCFMGVNATVNDHITIGDSCVIGSGALIVRDTESEKIYVGSAARAVPGKSSFDAEF